MKKAFIQTFGCQMNQHDSQRMAEILKREAYELVDDIKKADLILLNTCSVRENPENKVYSFLGRLSGIKKRKPGLIVGVAGCVAQQEGENILNREKSVDLVFGPDNIFKLPEMIRQAQAGERPLNTGWLPRKRKTQNFIPETELETGKVVNGKALIAITKGCDNHCSFCIVPRTRGRLVSRERDNILIEAENLIYKGAKEISLLGQNVNSYRSDRHDFFDLLQAVAKLNGLRRLRFISPHPRNWNRRLTELMAKESVICHQIHLPFQAGSNRILKSMRRGHTIEEYLEKINDLKRHVADLSISTDIIVGYPGETESEFEQTLDVLKKVRFNLVYSFKYSIRPGTRAAGMKDDVNAETKRERLSRLLETQQSIQSDLLEQLVGSRQEILVDSVHPKERHSMNGRNGGNIPVTVPCSRLSVGEIVEVTIVGRKKHSLIGEVT